MVRDEEGSCEDVWSWTRAQPVFSLMPIKNEMVLKQKETFRVQVYTD